ncbi:condensation domain-containing protein [Streptomyces syringium]|uniref:condensation domain-containing protein n=1 Tax=Streptomyces syringium TaxID=76729 RepID=UPI003454FF1A
MNSPEQPAAAAAGTEQRDFWFFQRMIGDPAGYHIAGTAALTGTLDPERLRKALNDVTASHAQLRCSFHHDGGEPRVLVHPAGTARPEFELHDAAGAGDPEAFLLERARRPFDLGSPCQLRAVLLRHAPDRHDLLLASHHLVLDGAALAQLLHESLSRYAGAPPAAVAPYAGYVGRQLLRRLRDGGKAAAHWRQAFDGRTRPLDLLSPPAAGAGTAARPGAAESFTVGPELRASLAARCRHERVSLFTGFLAALALVAHERGGAAHQVVGMPLDRRDTADAELGNYTTVLPLHLPDAVAAGPRLLQATQAVLLDTVEHSATSVLDLLPVVADAQPTRDDDAPTVPWRVMVTAVRSRPPARYGALHAGALRPISTGAKNGLGITFVDDGTQVTLHLSHPGNTTVSGRFGDELLAALGRVSEGSTAPAAPAAQAREPGPGRSPVAPSQVAEAVGAVIEQVLGAPLGPDEDFFQAGGNSIGVSAVLAGIRRHFGVRVLVREFFRTPTPAALTRRVQELQHSERHSERKEPPVAHTDIHPTPQEPAPTGSTAPPAVAVPADQAQVAEAVDAVIEQVLGAPLGPDEDFFQAGGNSIGVNTVLAEIRRHFGVRVLVREFFRTPTPAALTRRVQELQHSESQES